MAPSAGYASSPTVSPKKSYVKSTNSNKISAGSASSTADPSTKKSCSSSAPTAKKVAVTTPNKNDVLFGRGAGVYNHSGNQRYRLLVEAHKPAFVAMKRRKEKRTIALSIMQELHNLQPPGRFLIEDVTRRDNRSNDNRDEINNCSTNENDGIHPAILKRAWVLAANDKAMTKIMHSLREKANGATSVDLNNTDDNTTNIENEEKEDYYLDDDCAYNLDHLMVDDLLQRLNSLGDDDNDDDDNKEEDESVVGQYDDLFDDTNVEGEQVDGLLDNTMQEYTAEKNDVGQRDGSFHTEENVAGGLSDDVFDDAREIDIAPLNEKKIRGLDEDGLCESIHGHDSYDLTNKQNPLHKLTLRQWAVGCRSILQNFDMKSQMTPGQITAYTKAALPIALKLADSLIEAEEDETNGQGNPVSLESIRAENVLIQSKQPSVIRGGDEQREVIEHVWITSSLRGNPASGTVMDRLCAVGNVLYELFAGEEYKLTLEDSMPNHDGAVESIGPTLEEANGVSQPKKRSSQMKVSYSEDRSANCIAKLASKGVPSSVCALVNNLMGCGQGDHCDDDTYTSFHDLRTDLRLMLDDPYRFLDDIQVSNGLPSLEICDKLYGRESEEEKLDQLYQRHINAKELKGVIISGGAGIGKSRLAMHIQKLTSKANGYFYMAKFQQNNMHVKPLSTIGALFDSLCYRFTEDASPLQLRSVSDDLASALGNQAGLLAGVVPNLQKLMPCSISLDKTSIACVDAPSSMRYLFGELLRVVSHHSKRPISLLVDDIQFADHSSLLLISDLLFSAAKSDSNVFFAFCHRDNDPDFDAGAFNIWLGSISMYRLEDIKLNNMNVEGVNSLISDSLHLSPRITRPLSAVLHHKTMGNPLFLRQLLASLTGQRYIYIDLSQPRWTWDLKKIADQKISESVLALLVKEMKRLPSNLQLGLKVASCLGSCVQKNVLDILSNDVGMDLIDILQQVSQKGFMSIEDDGMMFSFAHDKIQQAAYELMSQQDQRKNHMQYGIAIWSYTLDNCPDNNELFFTAITQINHGGPSVISDPNQSTICAKLNLKAGKLSIVLSDYATALSLFEHGISYLGDDKWKSEYGISLDLFDSAAEAACVLNKNAAVTSYTEELVANAKSFDDSLNCLAVSAKCLMQAELLEESMSSSLDTLSKLGEQPLREISDSTLQADMMKMNEMLRNMPDESILNLHENKTKRVIITLKLYLILGHVLHFMKPSLIGSVSLRMVELTMNHGLVPFSAMAFTYYSTVLVPARNVSEGCRCGKLALKLVENKKSLVHKSAVISGVYVASLWACEPQQAAIEAHEIGRKVGEQTGDYLYMACNWHMSTLTAYHAGQNLDHVQRSMEDYIMTIHSRNGGIFVGGSILLIYQARVLKDGLCALDAKPSNNIPTEKEAVELFSSPLFLTNYKIHCLVRAYLFRRLDDVKSLDIVDVSDDIERNKHHLRAFFLFGIFFEGLASFLLARQTARDSERLRWIEKGEKVLTKIRYWSEHSSWNWEDKMVLLEAEKMYTMGNFDQAALLYEKAIRLAHEHKFMNDEAIASELAGIFFCERGLDDMKAGAFLLHSVQCYKTWGALAVARRVETFIGSKFGADCSSLDQRVDILKGILVVSQDDPSKKRKE